MAFWDIDLTTRMGAESSAQQGSLACFLYGGLTVFAGFMSAALLDMSTLEGRIAIGLLALQVMVCFVAGFLLRKGRGAYWAMAVAVLMVLEILTKLATMTGLLMLVINLVLLVVVIQGIRGALALRSIDSFDDEDAAAFD